MPQLATITDTTFADRRRTADRIFYGAFAFNAALTIFWLVSLATGRDSPFFRTITVTRESLMRVAFGVLVFNVLWGLIWYGVKALLLNKFVGFSKAERRQAFSSRMDVPFEVSDLVARYSERRIRIADMVGRRGRFVMLGMAGFFYVYTLMSQKPSADFATLFLQDNLFDGVITGWIFLAFYYANGWVGASFYGPQSRVMDGVLARANCLLITTLWAAFKFVMLPIGVQLARVFKPGDFAVVFGLIWGSYLVTDALAEIGGSLFGKQRLRVWGIGDVNRKSIGGTLSGFAGAGRPRLAQSTHAPNAQQMSAFPVAMKKSSVPRGENNSSSVFEIASATASGCSGSTNPDPPPTHELRRPGRRRGSRVTTPPVALGPRGPRRAVQSP